MGYGHQVWVITKVKQMADGSWKRVEIDRVSGRGAYVNALTFCAKNNAMVYSLPMWLAEQRKGA